MPFHTEVTSSPMRFEYSNGVFIVTCLNLEAGGKHIITMHTGESLKSFSHAKRDFWITWRERMPGYFLKPRHDS